MVVDIEPYTQQEKIHPPKRVKKVHLPKRVQVGGDPSCIIDSLRENPPGYAGFGRLLLAIQLSRPTDELYPEIIDRISSAKRILGIPSPRIKCWAKWLRVYDMRRRGTSYQRIQASLRVRAEEPEKVLGKQFAKIEKLIDGGYKKFI